MPRDPGQTARLVRRLNWDEIDAAWLESLATQARDEDLAGAGLIHRPVRPGDPSADLLKNQSTGRAKLVARRPMVIAGLGMMSPIFAAYGNHCHGRALVPEGSAVAAGTVVAEVQGPSANLLSLERILLNFLQRLSGVATFTAEHVKALGPSQTKLLDTRKTTPGFRVLEKYAVGQGGGYNHRLGLYDRLMVKDNHLAADGATTAADRLTQLVKRARTERPDLLLEVEVDHLEQIGPVLAAGADIIMLDNFSLPHLRQAVAFIRGRAWCEISGGVTLATLPELGQIGPDFISCGALTHSAPWVDLGLDWD
jgi:nicotinate-nucleotide pyrophosphorylase (carboxylating)